MKNQFKSTLNIFIAIALFSITSCTSKQSVWDVKDYGAVADSATVNTTAIQQAIDECAEAGGGIVRLDGGVFISGTILLKDSVTLEICEGSRLQGSINPNDYPVVDPFIDATGQFRGQCLIGAIDVENAAIIGGGTIDGMGNMFYTNIVKKTMKELGEELYTVDFSKIIADGGNYVNKKIRMGYRPFLVRMVRSKNVELKNITLRQPAAWTLHLFACEGFHVDGVKIYSHANRNNDAIDIDSSKDGLIENCIIDSGDDAICVKATSPVATSDILVRNCKIKSNWGAIKFGTESMGDFKNITITDCHIHDTKGGGIKILSADGANIENILIENITMERVEMPIFMRLCERRLVYRNAPQRPTGTINNVTIRNIKASINELEMLRQQPTTGIYISGTANNPIGTVTLENISISHPGGGTAEDAKRVVPENETQYPEFTMLGPTPSYGIYSRYVKDLKSKNITFNLRAEDKRLEQYNEHILE